MSLLPRAVYEQVHHRWRTDAPWRGEPESRWVTVLRVHCYEECFREPRRGLLRALWEATQSWLWTPDRKAPLHG